MLQMNGVALAYMGDAIYEVYVRKFLMETGVHRPAQFHHRAKQYVSAKAQAFLWQEMTAAELLSEAEVSIFKRGRNAHTHTKAKNTDAKTYAISTGFEAVLGYLYLTEETARLEEIINWCIAKIGKVDKYDPK